MSSFICGEEKTYVTKYPQASPALTINKLMLILILEVCSIKSLTYLTTGPQCHHPSLLKYTQLQPGWGLVFSNTHPLMFPSPGLL